MSAWFATAVSFDSLLASVDSFNSVLALSQAVVCLRCARVVGGSSENSFLLLEPPKKALTTALEPESPGGESTRLCRLTMLRNFPEGQIP